MSALTRVTTGEQAAVAPAAERVRLQVERVLPLVQVHEGELPRALLEGWEKLSGWARCWASPDRRRGRRLDHSRSPVADRRKGA